MPDGGGLLVAVVGSPHIAAIERTIARHGVGEPVILLSVVPFLPAAQADLRVPGGNQSLRELLVATRTDWLETCAEKTAARVETRVLYGGEVRTIIEEATHNGVGSVAVVGDTLASTRLVIARLIELCPGPLLIEAPARVETRSNVVAAIDPDCSPTLNEAIVAAGAARAHDAGGELHLVHAWELAGERELLHSTHIDLTASEVAVIADMVREAHRGAFEAVIEANGGALAPLDPSRVRKHLIEGGLRDAVCRVVDLDHVGLVVMGTEGRASVEQALGGSDARQVVDACLGATGGWATLILKPDDFTSPLLLAS